MDPEMADAAAPSDQVASVRQAPTHRQTGLALGALDGSDPEKHHPITGDEPRFIESQPWIKMWIFPPPVGIKEHCL